MRALVLALALVLVAPAAWAGIVPSLVVAHCDSFQYGNKPDANFVGFYDATLCSLTTGVKDSTNWGGSLLVHVGCIATRHQRALFCLVTGTYLSPYSEIDSVKMLLYPQTSAADSIFAAVVLKNVLASTGNLGTGLGSPFSSAADTVGPSAKYWFSPASAVADTAWNVRRFGGADSARTAFGGFTVNNARESSIAGLLAYNSTQDRGPWQFVGLARGVSGIRDTLDLTNTFKFIHNDLRATANYGFILKSKYSDSLVATHSNQYDSSEGNTAAQRPLLIIWSHDTRQPVIIGGGE